MTWTLSAVGHAVSAELEKELVDVLSAVLSDPKHTVSASSFQGSYQATNDLHRPAEPAAEAGETEALALQSTADVTALDGSAETGLAPAAGGSGDPIPS